MKKYTSHFLILTLITGIFGFSGLEFTGESIVRFVCLVSVIGLMVSCLDAVILSRKNRRFKNRTEKVKADNQRDIIE